VHPDLVEMHDRFVEKMGFLGTLFGFSKLVGQIYAELYLSPSPLGLNDLMEKLHVSKGSISTNIRELEKWGGCKKVWVKGDRRDYYEAETNFRAILNKRLLDALKRRNDTVEEMTREAGKVLSESAASADAGEKALREFYRSRIERIDGIRKKLGLVLKTVTGML
jgi:DNA-binding transcriptional regulator GbsR (MarR family)